MSAATLPVYAVFDDYRYSQRVAVWVRWFLLVAFAFTHNYLPDFDAKFWAINGMLVVLAALNGYVHRRILSGRPISRPYVIGLSVLDLSVISAAIGLSSGFDTMGFVLYYPALLGTSLVFSSRRLNFTVVTLVAAAYAGISMGIEPGVDTAIAEEKILILRIVAMFGVVGAGNLMTRIERERRREAVEAERVIAAENLELQQKAQQAELAAAEERHRIAREIHDGIAQSIYALNLNLETCAELAEREDGALKNRLKRLAPLAKQTLLETRHYIYDLKPLLAGERNVLALAENHVKEFRAVAGIPVELHTRGEPRDVSLATAGGCYRILQEALANTLKHARAEKVDVELSFDDESVELVVRDNGVGLEQDSAPPGYGVENMRDRARELGGEFELESSPGGGTRVVVTLSTAEDERAAD